MAERLHKRRRITQVITALVYNANIPGFFTGRIYQGALKGVCVPGLNCYSCPGALGACPLGSLQSQIAAGKRIPFYVIGFLLLFGALLARMICGFLCPFGLVQELVYKLPVPKLKKSPVTRILSYCKYVILAVLVVIVPLWALQTTGVGVPAFCKYLCPAGTLFGGIPLAISNASIRQTVGGMFAYKLAVLAAILALCAFMYRAFCRFLCPLGAIYSFFNGIALLGVKVDKDKCNGCNACVKYCRLDVKHVNSLECIRCGECARVCAQGAIYMETPKTLFKQANGKEDIQ